MKKFRHRKTREIAIYEDGVLKSSGFCVEIGVEPSSEFWEEIYEHGNGEHEIISFKFGVNHAFKQGDGKFSCMPSEFLSNGQFTVDEMIEKGATIYSAKRLSDGEVFTVGDKVKQSNVIHNNKFTITGFSLDVNKEHLLAIGNGGIKLSKIEKVELPLFKSEDGVDIYDRDKIFLVDKKCFGLVESIARKQDDLSNWRVFSSEEVAEDYILEHSPLLSIKEIYYLSETDYGSEFYKSLRQVVKRKLNEKTN